MTRSRRRTWLDEGADVTIRRATTSDATALRRLAALAESPELGGEVLVGEVDGELWAAVALADGRMLFDPFRPTLAVRELLALRRWKLAEAAGTLRRLERLRHRFA